MNWSDRLGRPNGTLRPHETTCHRGTKDRGASTSRRPRLYVAEALESRVLLSTAPILSGQTKAGVISPGAEVDTWTINAPANSTIVAVVGDTSGTAFYPRIVLKSPTNTVLKTGYGQVGGAVEGAAAVAGTYKIEISDYYLKTVGNYNVTVAVLPATQDAGGDAGPITSGQTKAGKIGLGDLDVFTFQGTAGGSAVLNFGDTSVSTFYPYAELYGPTGAFLDSGFGQVGAAVGNFALPATGTYFAVIRDYYASGVGNYNITAAILPSASHTTTVDGGVIASGQTKTGNVGLGDNDLYTFQGTKGGSVVINFADTSGNTFYPYAELFDPKGKRLTSGQGQVGSAIGNVNLPETGTYSVVIRDYYGAAAGNYSLSAAIIPSASHTTATDGGAMVSGKTYSGNVGLGDNDVFTFQGTKGGSAIIDVGDTSANTFYPVLEVYGPTGTRLASKYGQIGTVAALYNLAATGTYVVVVRDYYGAAAGNYNLTAAIMPNSTQDGGGDAGFIASGVNRNAKVDLGDLDVFPFYAVTGDKLEFAVTETGVGTLYPVMEVLGPTGNSLLLKFGTSGTTGLITSATATGLYYMVVRDYYGSGVGTYTASLKQTPSPTKPTINISAADAVAVESGPDTGKFNIVRNNLRALPVEVAYTVTGVAKNGTDYTTITGKATIQPNQSTAVVEIKPITDALLENSESVILTLASGTSYLLGTGKTATVNITDPASLAGTVFNDANGSGSRQAGELGLLGWKVWLDTDNDSVVDANERSATTDASGNWKIDGLAAGTYVARVLPIAGYKQTAPATPGTFSKTLIIGQAVTGLLFGGQKIA